MDYLVDKILSDLEFLLTFYFYIDFFFFFYLFLFLF